jgi:hypothetical protein
MGTKDTSTASTVEEKVAWAEACYQRSRSYLFNDKTVVDLLGKIKRAIKASRTQMVDSGMVALCEECEKDEGGSCCGAGMENRYDGRLLLINLLLEVKLPDERRDPKSCFFLAENGCVLQARHVICINYICKKITARIDPIKINALRDKEGEEVTLLFLLHEQLRKAIKD